MLCSTEKYDRRALNELGRICEEPVMAYLRYIFVFSQRGTRNTAITTRQWLPTKSNTNRCPGLGDGKLYKPI
jgi:hypothetical protein